MHWVIRNDINMSHLRVELQSLKRRLVGGYGFDLTRFCAGCWVHFGRITRRGYTCSACKRKVCKTCRNFVGAREWICISCHRKKYSPDDSWHDDANLEKFKASQGKCGTYLLRLTDWSSRGVLDVHAVKDINTRRTHSFCEGSFSKYDVENQITARSVKSKSEFFPNIGGKDNGWEVQLETGNRSQFMSLSMMNSRHRRENSNKNKLKYTSATLKQKRRAFRESKNTYNKKIFYSIDNENNDFSKSNKCRVSPFVKNINFNESDFLDEEGLKESSNIATHQIQFPAHKDRLTVANHSMKINSKSSANSVMKRELLNNKTNCNNFPLESSSLHRNDPHMRFSVRGNRIFSRKKTYRAYLSPKEDDQESGKKLSSLKARSSSLPCELPLTECHDYEFWNAGFVQCRVRRLEEDLSANWDDGYNLWSSNFEVQSLCSLELDRIRPDSDDYRIAYLSSTSQDSSLDYIDDNFSSFGMGTLDVKIHKKYRFPENEDWDLSLSSNDEHDSTSDDDEFYFLKKNLMNDNAHFVSNSHSYSSLKTKKNCSNPSGFADDLAEACSSDNTKCKETIAISGFLCKEENSETETGMHFGSAPNSSSETNRSVNKICASETTQFLNNKSFTENIETNRNEVPIAQHDVTSMKGKVVKTAQINKHILYTNGKFVSLENRISHPENIRTGKNKRLKSSNSANFENILKIGQKFQIDSYEPLCTPFAEIYSINCGINPIFKMAASVNDNSATNENILNEGSLDDRYAHRLSTNVDKSTSLSINTEFYATCNSLTCDLEPRVSNIPQSFPSVIILSKNDSFFVQSAKNIKCSYNKLSCDQYFTYFLSDSYETRRIDLISCLKPKINTDFLTKIEIEMSHFYNVLSKELNMLNNIALAPVGCNATIAEKEKFPKTLSFVLKLFCDKFSLVQFYNEKLQAGNFFMYENLKECIKCNPNYVNGLFPLSVCSRKLNFGKNLPKCLASKCRRMISNVKGYENTSNQIFVNSHISSKMSPSSPKFCGSNRSTSLHERSSMRLNTYTSLKKYFKKRNRNKITKEFTGAYFYTQQIHASDPKQIIALQYSSFRNKHKQNKEKNSRKEEKQIVLYKNKTNRVEQRCLSSKNFINAPIKREFGKRWKNSSSNAYQSKKNQATKINKTLNMIYFRFLLNRQPRNINELLRNQNYFITNSNNHSSETENSTRMDQKGETAEGGFFPESLPVTSQTGSTAFVEYLVLPQCTSARKQRQFSQGFRSSSQLSQQSVPAVQRVSREREFATTVGTLCLATADGAVILHPTADGDRNSCRIDCGKWLNSAVEQCFGYPLISDYGESERTALPDYCNKDYLRPGRVPTKTFEQLICDFTVSRCRSDYCDLCSVCVCCGELNEKMAACDSNARHVNKVTRTPGRNISKLKKFFDSNTVASFAGDSNSSRTNSEIISSHENNISVVNSIPSDRCSIGLPAPNDADNQPSVLISASSSVNNFKTFSDSSTQSSQNSASEIQFSSNSFSGDLWKNVNIGAKTENEGLWTSAQNYDNHHFCDNFAAESKRTDQQQMSNAFVASTAELNCLIAVSRAELSKKKEPVLSDKSTLENYFTSFENNKTKKCVPLEDEEKSHANCNSLEFNNSFDCDIDEITFDDEDATYSDTSSDEELKSHPSAINTYLPSYALHTIIEESCEESERDSRGATPTNNPAASKLERYFSWDIINDNEHNLQKRDDDESTIYSDSLSEGSGSANGDAMKEIDPIQLASSRLEKYFTSGLVGNENYFYPDDAEFLDDPPVSDFEDDSVHQKISRSALLNSLETKPSSDILPQSEKEVVCSGQDVLCNDQFISEKSVTSDNIQYNNDKSLSDLPNEEQNILDIEMSSLNDCSEKTSSSTCYRDELSGKNTESHELKPVETPLDTSLELKSNCDDIQNEVHNMNTESSKQKQILSKEQLAIDAQAIIKKLLMYFSHSTSESFQEKTETDYVSAWQILETEIERLMQSISPTASLENHSCNNSTIDSNNSDYGSDTIESLDCMTDDDDNTDAKSRVNAKYPFSSFLNSTFKIPSEYDLRSFHISDETLSIWKRLIHSLQRDNSYIADDKINDVNSEARLYIKEQIITLMHTMTINESNCIKEQDVEHKESFPSSTHEKDFSNLNEAFNTCVTNSNMLPHLLDSDILDRSAVQTESSDEVLSLSSNENFPVGSNSSYSTKIPLSETSEEILHSCTPESVDIPDLPVINNSDAFPTSSSQGTKFAGDKIAVDEVDLKHGNKHSEVKLNSKDDLNFSVFVDIELDEEATTVTQRKPSKKCSKKISDEEVKTSSCHLWVDDELSELDVKQSDIQELPIASKRVSGKDQYESVSTLGSIKKSDTQKNTQAQNKSQRDTGYFSYKSSDDSLLNSSIPPGDFEVPNFKSLKRSVKKFPLTNTLSKSTNNINQTFSTVEAKFSTLQLKSQKSKVSMNPSSTPSRQFTSLFSPSAVFKRLTGSKSNDATTPESSIPSKYLKKYARSSSIDNESMFGAISMPQLNCPKNGDSYSAIGLYSENDKDSTITIDDEGYSKPFACSQSALSLGSHSASMTSVYSAAGCHYGYVTISGDVLFGLNYNQKSQMMEVFVKQCRNLAAVDTRRNKSDPYVKVYLLPDKTKGGKRKTKTKKSTLNPVFNELLRFPVLKHELESRTLWLSVWNSDLFGRNDFLGEITLPLGYRLLDSPTLRWYPLQERMESLTSPLNYKGELFLALKYVPRDLSLESRFRPAPVISLRGALHVLVKEARKISGNRSNGTFDAFCKSYLLPDKSKSSKQKTPVVKKSRHPKWYYTMIYEDMSIEELKERSLELTIWDHDKITSNEFMGGVRLNTGSGLYHGVAVDWMDARRDESSLWDAMLESPNMWVDGCLPLRPTMQFRHS